MARTRRSARLSMTKPVALSREEQFENLISRAGEYGNGAYAMREFQLPNHIFVELRTPESINRPRSALESLPTDVVLDIVNQLTGNDQIMLALSSKLLASIVENSSTRKLINVHDYIPPLKEWRRFYQGASEDELRRAGYCSGGTFHQQYGSQHVDMRRRIQQWLGPAYKFCVGCKRFRFVDEQWWLEFVEYEMPGLIVNQEPVAIGRGRSRGNASRRGRGRGKGRGRGQDRAENSYQAQIQRSIRRWAGTTTDGSKAVSSSDCPVHDFLRERNGKRLIMETTKATEPSK